GRFGVACVDERAVVVERLVDLALFLQELGAFRKCLDCAAVLAAAQPGIGSLFLGVGEQQQLQSGNDVVGLAAYHLADALDACGICRELAGVGVVVFVGLGQNLGERSHELGILGCPVAVGHDAVRSEEHT